MDNQRKQDLIKTLADNGMTVLLTRDHSAIMLELAILKRFDRLVRQAATVGTPLQMLVKDIDRGAAALRASVPQS